MRLPDSILYGRLLLAVAGGLLCAALSYFQLVRPLDRMVYDLFNEASHMPVADDIAIVAIDERSLLQMGRWPWPREKHVELLRQLSAAGARAVAMDILFAEPDVNYPEVDKLLAQAMEAQGAVILPVFIGQASRGGELREMLPIPSIAVAAANLGHVHIEMDSDGVARSVFLKEGVGRPNWSHFTVALAEVLGLDVAALPGVTDQRVLLNPDPEAIIRDKANLIPFMGPAGTVQQIPYVDVMLGLVPPETLRDKIIFVGATAAGHVDNITTSHGQISGVEINANIFQGLRGGWLGRPVHSVASASILLLITALTILVFTRMNPRNLLLAVLSSAVVLPLASYLVFYLWRLWISPSPLVLTLLVAYPLWNWLRLDAAVGFIQAQLLKLEKENSELSHQQGWADVERAANFLQKLGHVARWQWIADVPPGDLPDSERHWQREATSSSRVFTFDANSKRLRLYWHSGHEIIARKLYSIFPDDSAHLPPPGTGADFININLAQLDFAYREARHNRDLIKDTLEQLGSGVILSDLSGDILLINDQARELLQLQAEPTDLLSAIHNLELEDTPDMLELINALVARGEQFSHEGHSPTSGKELLCQGGMVRLDRPLLLLVLTDVSELKESEKQRVEALNFLSHDLRAPLTSVLALIEASHGQQPEQELLGQIESYIRQNLSYAENFIHMAKVNHRQPLQLDECDSSSLADNVVAQLFHSAESAGIKLRIDYGEQQSWLHCNRSLVERALINLIDNALKYSEGGSQVTLKLDCDQQYAVFTVIDQGPGIAQQDMERIFDHFEQGANARGGVGLGLRFVSAVANAHGGSVSVSNMQ